MYTIPHEQILFHKFIKFIPHVQIKELSFKIYRSYDVRSKQNVLRIAIDLSTQKKSRLLKTILRVNNFHDYSNIVFFLKKNIWNLQWLWYDIHTKWIHSDIAYSMYLEIYHDS